MEIIIPVGIIVFIIIIAVICAIVDEWPMKHKH